MSSSHGSENRANGRFLTLLCLLWVTGASTRLPILAVPPILPLIHDDLHLVETQVGLLVALPVILFAIAAVPGSLLVTRIGVLSTAVIGLIITAFASAARGATIDITSLYAATVAMGFGIAVIQPALPQLVQQWMPARIALGTAVYTNGILVATTSASASTIPVVLPAVGMNWRYALVVWSIPVGLTALALLVFAPRAKTPSAPRHVPMSGWWPDWKSPMLWQLGVTFAANNSIFFGINAFVPDYLSAHGRGDLISVALGAMNGGQLLASFVMMAGARWMHRRAWPFLVFGSSALAALIGIMFVTGPMLAVLVGCLGFSTSISYVTLLALPPVLSAPNDVHRTAAGMFTISFTCAVLVPTLAGAVWDLTGAPWAAFVPLALCALGLIVVGARLARLKPYGS